MMNEFLDRLKQRKLVQWAIAYVAAAFAFLQGIDIVAQRFGWPDIVERALIIAACIGFFLALILAWYHGERGTQRVSGTELLIIGLVLALGGGFLWRFAGTSRPGASNIPPLPNDRMMSGPAQPIPAKSIAVLPFDNLSRDPDNAYFCEGVQDEILTRLAKVADLKVISRTSTEQFKSKPDDLPQIAQQLGVAHILEGSVQKARDQVRVNVQLINATSNAHLWADTYDRKLTDIFAVESEIAQTIADTLQAKLTGAEKALIAARPTSDTAAYELYLKGRALWAKRSGDNLPRAIAFYQQAIERDPNYALAYSGLAEAYAILPLYSDILPREAHARAKTAALKALQLNDKLAEAHTALGFLLSRNDLDMAGSVGEFQRAIALNPNYATAHQWYGVQPLAALGRFDEAVAEEKRAIELDPLSLVNKADLGWILMLAGRYDDAIAHLRKVLEIDPTFYPTHFNLGVALQLKGDFRGAIGEYKKAEELSADLENPVMLATAEAQLGDKNPAVKMLSDLEKLGKHHYAGGAYWRALLYLSLGNRDDAIRCLEQTVADPAGSDILFINVFHFFDPLRDDPRFHVLVQRVIGPKDG